MNHNSANIVKPKVIHVEDAESFGSEEDGRKYCINIMVSAEDSGGAWTYTYDTYEKDFVVHLHYHKKHDEIFSIIEGEMEWKVGDASYFTKPGTVLWIPKGTPHGFKALTDCKMNMFYSPGGYEYTGKEYAQMTPEDKENETKMKSILEKHDVVRC
jgi:quercetin dioxygenase-like cupin family protein